MGLAKIENFLNKNRKLVPKYEGPYKIISLKPHNNVEIAVRKRSHVIVHVNRLKPYHEDSKFQTFTDNFQKQGVMKILIFRLMKKKRLKLRNQKSKSKEEEAVQRK